MAKPADPRNLLAAREIGIRLAVSSEPSIRPTVTVITAI